ncbi:MAG: AsmA family protein [Rhodospirillales bacterium]|nr:AsmA family protein [Rhodospirillales bacterium]
MRALAAEAQGEDVGAAEALAAVTQGELASFIEEAVEAYTGRDVSIGRFDVNLDWEALEVLANDVSLANADWAAGAPMLAVRSVRAKLDPAALLSGRLVLPLAEISGAKLIYAINEAGQSNLPVQQQASEDERPFRAKELPLVRDLKLDDVKIVYSNRVTGADTVMDLAAASFSAPEGEGMSLSVDGFYEGLPLKVSGSGGSWRALTQPDDDAFALDVAASVGPLSAKASGTVAEPFAGRGMDLAVRVEGDEVPAVFPINNAIVAPTPSLALSTRLTTEEDTKRRKVWSLSDFKARLDDTEVTGELTLVATNDRRRVAGSLRAEPFHLDDIVAFFSGPDQDEGPEEEADGQVLPDEQLQLSFFQRLDADLDLDLLDVRMAGMPLDRLSVELALEDGILRLQPMHATQDGAEVTIFMSLYSEAEPVQTDVKLQLRRLSLDRIVPDLPVAAVPLTGRLGGEISLGAHGNSVAELLGSASGDILLAMDRGQISGLLIELLGIDIVESLGLVVTEEDHDDSVPIRCAIADLALDEGRANIKHFIIDTRDTLIRAEGTIDLGEETLDVKVVPHPKDFSLLSLRSTIGIGGTFAQPQVFPDPVGLGVEDTADKVANAILAPILGLLPPIDTGLGGDSQCRKLLEQAKGGSPS